MHYKTHMPARFSVDDQMAEALASQELMGNRQRKNFLKLFRKYSKAKKASIDWNSVKPPTTGMLTSNTSVESCPNDMNLRHELLDKLVILKLNGGLGTTLGCEGPKSAIEVRQDLSFLDLTVRQVEYINSVYGVDVPLVLMNSFNTHEETVRIIRKYRMHNLSIHTFNQSCYPFIVKETMLPLPNTKYDRSTREKWFPPGHGDVYNALFESGLLENLINQGKEYIFISNVDNLGATVNLDMLYHMINEESEFVMEVTEKTRADVQGGTLVSYKDKPHLLEASQVPPEHMDDFRAINKFETFNTNNLWVNLRAIQRLVAQDLIDIEPLVTFRNVKNHKVVQLETAAGEAIHLFKNFIGLKVPRSRFLPVKSSSDLFLVQSNLYQIKHGSLIMNPARTTPTIPIVKLGLEFQSAKEYLARFEHGIPNITELDHLTVAGDVKFGSNITLKGTVILVANEGAHIDLPDGTVLENKVVTGNLRILDH
ncbi:UTP--glucose-1-phosphate uridylyltransferase [Phytophthora fragariae]|uniref:UTP--glucose-1-phosphate uridylyltransferase n=2 Tax=Phytophthora TaxID=4783 RepID=A0A6A3YK06_9STRA|nr:UTP--glucose-1-phosphate uridylyltransferase [Phytophthora fragariae]KAE9011383.1 UTP--glucose-1-phosphate uridylyltransferase [Phytophthora rubi]KAE8987633.1 UTP--glucose-1-phosphate uridylyltransferase [Phytophthora fragariae]KAE9016929.1 UTP--glucose-1-phosphate uridylyltransferase [Phytophthora rubi]KAE9085946.1 UTP--glucose-1-phosphate uridylyltransferase [Phytophthora fragariae]